MFAFSTCWNSDAYQDGEPMLEEIRSLGFSNIELSHGIRISLLEGIERAMKADTHFKIRSVHNFCPLPIGYLYSAPNVYLLSSENESERQKAIRQTIHTMDFAAKLGVRFVVLHLGSVPMVNYTDQLLKLIQQGKQQTAQYYNLFEKAVAKRQDKGRRPFLKTMKSLEALIQPAEERNIILGIENRYCLEEIPSEEELSEVLGAFDATEVGYWHDCGHAETWCHLGLMNHIEWLNKFGERLVGAHLHDAAYPGRDHQIPGKGTVPFFQLKELRYPKLLKVFEFEPGTPVPVLKEQLPEFMKTFEISAL